MLSPEASLREVKGVGEKRFLQFKERGLVRVGDLLLYLPRKYERRGRIQLLSEAEGEAELLVKVVKRKWWKGKKHWMFEAIVEDDSGKAKAVWFNRKYLMKVIFPGVKIYLRGKVERGKEVIIKSPEVRLEWEGGIIPVYERIGSISSRLIRRLVRNILPRVKIKDRLPEELRDKYRFPSLRESLVALHIPDERLSLEELNSGNTPFHRRIIFEEAFFYHLSLMYLREKSRVKKEHHYIVSAEIVSKAKSIFPFRFTESQERALKEIVSDLSSPFPMRRLLQGEVGSGKTAVAVVSGIVVALSGYQVAFMAPTEVLALQHFKRLAPALSSLGVTSELLTSGMKPDERRMAEQRVSSGEARFVFGTHALFYEGVKFKNLAYAIVDEQQRFGVAQRARLYNKGRDTDILLLSATPIPRTLALVLYSDLKLSTLRNMPNPRHVETKVMKIKDFKKLVPFIKEMIKKGIQGFAIFPVIEKSKTELIDAERGKRRLEEYFPGTRVELLHGRMKSEEKKRVMEEFEKGNIDILASTTVIEVGIDIERAGFMIVFNGERFGLAQLHQLRGRIGRGRGKGYFFVLSDSTVKRLRYLEKTDDGFKISEYDLQLRGPGNLAGRKQWGIPRFKLLNPFLHQDILYRAKEEAVRYLGFMKGEILNIIEEEITLG